MNTTLNTQILIHHGNLRLPVGQLAKRKIIQLNPNENKALEVGRHKDKTSRRSALTHERRPAPEINAQKLLFLTDLDLKNHLIDILTDQLPSFDLFVHNGNYLNAMLDIYSTKEMHLFKLLLRFFALGNKMGKVQEKKELLQTTEHNFLQVLQLLKQRKNYQLNQQIRPHNKQKVVEIIYTKFKNESFGETEICQHLYLTFQQVEKIVKLLLIEKLIKATKGIKGAKNYQLTKKPFSYVTSN